MLKTQANETLVLSVTEAFETMAFMMAMPPMDELAAPDDSILVTMSFRGPVSGTVELCAPSAMAQLIAANIMGLEPDDETLAEKGIDAIKEMLNTTCGLLLPRLAESPADVFQVTIPAAEACPDSSQWQAFIARPDTAILDVDGSPLACRIALS